MNRFLVEQNGKIYDGINIQDSDIFEQLKMKTFEEICEFEDLNTVINSTVEIVLSHTHDRSDIALTLADETGIFIWSIVIQVGFIRHDYKIYNWRNSNKNFKYVK